jgi:hypothetical protein
MQRALGLAPSKRFLSVQQSWEHDISLRGCSFIPKLGWIEQDWGEMVLSQTYRGLNPVQFIPNLPLTEINEQA